MIVSSEIIDDRIIDGVRVVEMRFVDEAGRACYCSQQVEEKEDCVAMMLALLPVMEKQFAELAKITELPPISPIPEVRPALAGMTGEGPPKLDAPDGETYLDVTEIWLRRDGKWKRRGKS